MLGAAVLPLGFGDAAARHASAALAGSSAPPHTHWMTGPLRVEDLLPLIAVLPREQRIRLVRLVLAAAPPGERDAYAALSVHDGEFGSEEDGLAWEAEGWDGLAPPR